MRVYIESYGCTFNKTDAQIIAGILKENKIDLVDSIEESDVIILNTCYVKLPTENKVVYKIQQLQENYPEKKIVVSGCMVEIDPEKLEKIGPNCSWIGPHQLNKSAQVVESAYCGEIMREYGLSKDSKVGLPKISEPDAVDGRQGGQALRPGDPVCGGRLEAGGGGREAGHQKHGPLSFRGLHRNGTGRHRDLVQQC